MVESLKELHGLELKELEAAMIKKQQKMVEYERNKLTAKYD